MLATQSTVPVQSGAAEARQRAQSRSGAAALEMALAVPVLVLLLAGVVSFGQLFFAAITLANAAESGALYGVQSNATTGDTAGIRQAAQLDAQSLGGLTVSSSRVCKCDTGATVSCTTGHCGAYGVPQVHVQVTVSRTVSLIFPVPGVLPASRTLSQSATFRTQ